MSSDLRGATPLGHRPNADLTPRTVLEAALGCHVLSTSISASREARA